MLFTALLGQWILVRNGNCSCHDPLWKRQSEECESPAGILPFQLTKPQRHE
jgi:hypothetical protein